MISKKVIQKITLLALAITLTVGLPTNSVAQCPMCKMSAESNLKNGGTAGKGLNNGILFMLLTPYLIIGVVGYVWYKNRIPEEKKTSFKPE